MPIYLYDKATQKRLFEITDAERQALIDSLEEEHDSDVDYYLDANTLDFLSDKLSPEFLGKLKTIVPEQKTPAEPVPEGTDVELDESAGIEVEWREEA